MKNNIRVLVGRSVEQVDEGQCDDVRPCDTLKEAKDFAKYALTEDYQRSGEFSEPMNYARIMVGDEVHADRFRKGYSPPQVVADEC